MDWRRGQPIHLVSTHTSPLKAPRSSLHTFTSLHKIQRALMLLGWCKKAVREATPPFSETRYILLQVQYAARHPSTSHVQHMKGQAWGPDFCSNNHFRAQLQLTLAGQRTKPRGLLSRISIATKRLKPAHRPGSGTPPAFICFYVSSQPRAVTSERHSQCFWRRDRRSPEDRPVTKSHEAVCWQRGTAHRTLSRLRLLIKTIMVWIQKKLGMAQMDVVLLVCRKLINIYYEL